MVYLPDNLGVTVRASIDFANGHSIQSDFSGAYDLAIDGRIRAAGGVGGGEPQRRWSDAEAAHDYGQHFSLRRIKKIQSDDDRIDREATAETRRGSA